MNKKNKLLLTGILTLSLNTYANNIDSKAYTTHLDIFDKPAQTNLFNLNQNNLSLNNQSPLKKSYENTYTSKEINETMKLLDNLEYSSQIDPHIKILKSSLENTFIANYCTNSLFPNQLVEKLKILDNIWEFKEGLYNLGYYKLGHHFTDMYENKELSSICENISKKCETL